MSIPYRPAGRPAYETIATMEELVAAGHREVAPVYLREKGTDLLGIRGAHGLYRMGVHPDGRVVLLFAQDPQALAPMQHRDPAFRATAPGYYLDLNRLKDIEVVAARQGRTQKKWVTESVNRHAYHYNEMRPDCGYLTRLSDRVWASRCVVYAVEPLPLRHKQYDHTREKFVVKCYTSSGRTLSIQDMAEKLRDGKLNWLQKWGARSCIVPADEIEDVIRDDFIKRAILIGRNIDPGRLGRLKKEPELSSILSPPARKITDIAKCDARHYSTRVLQNIERQIRQIRAQYVAMGFLRTLAMSAVQLVFKGLRASIGTAMVSVFQPVIDLMKRIEILNRKTEDIGPSFWQKGRSIHTGEEHYCRLDAQQGTMIRLLGYEESRVRPYQGAEVRNALPPTWAEDHIMDLLDSPMGSVVESRDMLGERVLHVEQPDGVAVHYMLGRDVRYATLRPERVHALAEQLPQPVEDLFAAKGMTVKVTADAHGVARSAAVDDISRDMAAEAKNSSGFSIEPRVDHSLRLLEEFRRAAYPPPPSRGLVGQILSTGYNAAGKAIYATGLIRRPPEVITPERRKLEENLADRGPV